MKIFNYFILFLFFSIALTTVSCGSKATLEAAEEEFRMLRYYNAAEMYESLYRNNKYRDKRGEIAFRAGESYRLSGNYRSATMWYERAILVKYSDPVVYYKLGQVHKMNEEYEKAIVAFNNYLKEVPGDKNVQQELENTTKAAQWKEQDSRWVVELFRPANSRSNDFSPILTNNGNLLVFTSDREDAKGKKLYGWTGQSHSDLFMVERGRGRQSDRWGMVEPVPGEMINTNYNEGVATFDSRGNVMYYTQCNGPRGDLTHCRILVSTKRGREWGDPEILPFCNDTTVNYGHPALSPDGNRLYFSSDMPGGYGGYDIYVSFYVSRGRTWSDPVNLGPVINTEGDEKFPYMLNDTTLYFSSNGHPGMGGLDIFVSHGRGEEWTKPENLKYPINSGGDDFGIVFESGGESGFFSSNRDARNDKIYSFLILPLEFTLRGVVYNVKTNEPEGGALVKLSSPGRDQETHLTDQTGSYFFKLDEETFYTVSASKNEFFSSLEEMVSTEGYTMSYDFIQDLYIEPFPETEIVLEDLFYGLDSANIRPASAKVLDSLVLILNEYPAITIKLGSHTDCRAPWDYNIGLSQRRADSAVAYLLRKGIHPARLEAVGYGESQPEIECYCDDNQFTRRCNEDEHQKNRRTTFQIIGRDFEESEAPPKEEVEIYKKLIMGTGN